MVSAMSSPSRVPDRLRIGRHEVARFVENVVGGQQDLGLPHHDFAAADHRRRIGGLLAGRLVRAPDIAGDDGERQVLRRVRELLDRRFGALDEAAAFRPDRAADSR